MNKQKGNITTMESSSKYKTKRGTKVQNNFYYSHEAKIGNPILLLLKKIIFEIITNIKTKTLHNL
jgi:hypothetical protein